MTMLSDGEGAPIGNVVPLDGDKTGQFVCGGSADQLSKSGFQTQSEGSIVCDCNLFGSIRICSKFLNLRLSVLNAS